MNIIQLTLAQFNELPESRYPPKPREVGFRWKRWYGDGWVMGEYVQVNGFREILILRIVISDGPVAAR